MTRPAVVVMAILFVCSCLDAAVGSPVSLHSLCKKLCGQCKGIGRLKDGVCLCKVPELQLKKSIPSLLEAKKKALSAGFNLIQVTSSLPSHRRIKRCHNIERERKNLRGLEAAPHGKTPEDIIAEIEAETGLISV